MLRAIKTTILALVAVTAFAVPVTALTVTGTAHAAVDESKRAACQGIGLTTGSRCGGGADADVSDVVSTIVNIVSVIVGIVAVIMIIVAGLKYITGGGDANSVTSAKNTLIYAIVGLIIVALAQFIVKFVLQQVRQ